MRKSYYFYGNKVSDYGIENGYIDYRTLAKCGECVLCNNILNHFDELELVSGCDYDEENDEYTEIFQAYIISDNLARIMMDEFPSCNEIIYYHRDLDIYVWGITHFGTSWDYVLTEIPLLEMDY